MILDRMFLTLDFKRVTSMGSYIGEDKEVVDKDIRATER